MPRLLDPDTAAARMLTAGAQPLEDFPGVDTPWKCRCLACGRVCRPRLSSVVNQGPCAPCGRARAAEKMRRDVDDAEQIMRAAGLQPIGPYPGANAPWSSHCVICGAAVAPRFNGVRRGSGCRRCADRARGAAQLGRSVSDRGKPGDAQSGPLETMRAAGMEPLVPYEGRTVRWHSRCLTCGTLGLPTLGGVLGGQGGCIPCGQAKAAAAARSRRLDGAAAAEEMTTAGITPLVDYPGSDRPWSSRCALCERQIRPSLVSVRRGRRCRFCASHGLDYTRPALVYVMTHTGWSAGKVGIGAPEGPNSRVAQHQRAGWQLYAAREFSAGWAARDVEQAVLDELRREQLAPFLTAADMPNGWTETWDADRISAAQVWALVNALADSEGTVDGQHPLRRRSAVGLVDPRVAAAELRAAGLEPLVPYPGWANTAWPARCLRCGKESRPRLNGVRRGGGCRGCRSAAAGAAKIAAHSAEARAVMLAAGFQPQADYPGSQRRWLCRCDSCGQQSTPTYSNVKQGSRCRHCHPPYVNRLPPQLTRSTRSRTTSSSGRGGATPAAR
ncbi:MAG: hypothetical protein QOJ11_424 [Frankiales bacterium]|jgi:hypothetical protein|nr:hypothetical protein [Frankiales bacterium]